MNRLERLFESKVRAKGVLAGGDKFFYRACFVLASEFGWSYADMMGAPMPFVLRLLDELKKESKRRKSGK